MRLPLPTAQYSQRVRYGRYVARRLRRAKRIALATDVEAATLEILKRGRELEDADGPVQEAMADRDAADDDLDTAAQRARNMLAGRGVEAMTTAPYTLIFPQGIGYYTAAPLDEETERYDELRKRLVELLPPDDPARKDTILVIDAGIAAFNAAVDALSKARTEEALASTRLDTAEDAWNRLMTKVYGLLISELGRPAAERFFPKAKVGKKKSDDSGT
ncbi:hypothetical protein [Polyangium aurulentum]|uniref:hypothetical protein n=1 Tax=Polyangium aurulentum TaxID=2567896 RepID=UPI0010AE6BD6|nr:hypothetical protein [Polyangium aurulentum]UQA57326.1 hypothetical protein E8A73_039515 [Polyangium aurulentum]